MMNLTCTYTYRPVSSKEATVLVGLPVLAGATVLVARNAAACWSVNASPKSLVPTQEAAKKAAFTAFTFGAATGAILGITGFLTGDRSWLQNALIGVGGGAAASLATRRVDPYVP